MSIGTSSSQGTTQAKQPPACNESSNHGSSGEGSGSAMARLIRQEQARIVPGAQEDAPNGSS